MKVSGLFNIHLKWDSSHLQTYTINTYDNFNRNFKN